MAEQPLHLGVFFDQCHAGGLARRGLEVANGLGVHREEAAGGAVFRGHVSNGCTILQRQRIEAGTAIFDELADHAVLSEHLGHRQHQIGGGDALAQFAGQAHADHLGDQHRHRLAEHRRFGLDAAHAPAQHRQAADHGGVAIGADQRIGKGIGDGLALLVLAFARPDGLGEVLQVDLMADAGVRRHDPEIGKRLLAPTQKSVALFVALVFDGDILLECRFVAEMIHHHRMIDHQIDIGQRVDRLGIAPQRLHGVAQGGKIDHRRHAGQILHQDAGRREGDFASRRARL